jgi:hypothetical protein
VAPFDPLTPSDTKRSAGAPPSASSSVVRALVAAVERAGMPRAEFQRAAQLDFQALGARDGRMPLVEVYRLCELALDLTGDPALGLHWAETLNDHSFALISVLLAHSASLGQALGLLAQFFQILCDQPAYRVIENNDELIVQCPRMGESLRSQRFVAEMEIVGFSELVRSFSPRARSLHVNFAYEVPDYRDEYARLFEGVERFDQPFTSIVYDRALLNAPSAFEDREVRDALVSIAKQRL